MWLIFVGLPITWEKALSVVGIATLVDDPGNLPITFWMSVLSCYQYLRDHQGIMEAQIVKYPQGWSYHVSMLTMTYST
jgi:hypothetical protein